MRIQNANAAHRRVREMQNVKRSRKSNVHMQNANATRKCECRTHDVQEGKCYCEAPDAGHNARTATRATYLVP
jgi:hypothetical protein